MINNGSTTSKAIMKYRIFIALLVILSKLLNDNGDGYFLIRWNRYGI